MKLSEEILKNITDMVGAADVPYVTQVADMVAKLEEEVKLNDAKEEAVVKQDQDLYRMIYQQGMFDMTDLAVKIIRAFRCMGDGS